jgi:hypothetical protein
MVPPTPPGPVQEPTVEYSTDPNARMEKLLQQSEDLRQIQKMWRRIWFNDQPSHLTPERVHGGVR